MSSLGIMLCLLGLVATLNFAVGLVLIGCGVYVSVRTPTKTDRFDPPREGLAQFLVIAGLSLAMVGAAVWQVAHAEYKDATAHQTLSR